MSASALSSSSPTADECSRQGSAKASCQRSRSLRTCAHSTGRRGEAAPTWCVAGSLASRGAAPASGRGPKIRGTCGLRWRELSMKSDRDSSSQRTFPWPPLPSPGETFEAWATESRQLSDSVRATSGAHSRAIAGGYLLPCLTTKCNEWSGSMLRKWDAHARMLCQVGRRLRGGEMAVFRHVLMGFPIGWADRGSLATRRFQRWLQLHSGS